MIYDIFSFNNEIDMLDLRLNILDPYVDKFVLVEANTTFSGVDKPFHYEENKKRFEKFHHKIIHCKIERSPKTFEDSNGCDEEYFNMALNSPNVTREHYCWLIEFYQKEYIKKALVDLNDDDICYVCDVDEIWNYDLSVDIQDGVYKPMINNCYIEYLNVRTNENWTYFTGPIITKYKNIKNECLNHLRTRRFMDHKYIFIENGGWHFNALGGIDKKIEDFSHPVYHKNYMEMRKNGYRIDETGLPEYIIKNKEHLKKYFLNYTPTIGVVVARYAEDIKWLDDIKNPIYLYEKGDGKRGIKLNNVGREAHTYLYHIVDRYDTLEDYIIFLQGNPFDHGFRTVEDINNIEIKSDFIPLNGLLMGCKYGESKGTIPAFCETHNIDISYTELVTFTPGAQFVVSREFIKKHPKEFYEKLLDTMSKTSSNPEEAHVMERLWGYIFNDKFGIN